MRRRGFTMIEVVFAMGIMALALLALVTLFSTSIHVDKKSNIEMIGARIADRELQRLVQDALTGQKPDFWKQDYPYPGTPLVTNSTTVGSDVYTWTIYATTISAANGSTLGSGYYENVVKKAQIIVRWGSSDTRQGSGKVSTSMSRLVGQGDTP